MVKGSVQEKGGYLHTVISYTDKDGKRKQKWQSTGLTAKGNKRKAQELLKERIDELEMTLERQETQMPDMPFSQFMSNWLAMIKPTVLITTYGSYQYFIEKRINPYFDEKNIDAVSARILFRTRSLGICINVPPLKIQIMGIVSAIWIIKFFVVNFFFFPIFKKKFKCYRCITFF